MPYEPLSFSEAINEIIEHSIKYETRDRGADLWRCDGCAAWVYATGQYATLPENIEHSKDCVYMRAKATVPITEG